MSDAINRLQAWAKEEVGKCCGITASRIPEFAADVRILLAAWEQLGREVNRLTRVKQDHINVLRAALYIEPDGIALVNRLTTYAIEQRKQP